MVAGEIMSIDQIYGHADFHEDGVVPFLLVNMVKYAMEQYPEVKYVTYDMFFGSSETLRRFKRKFGFAPYRVEWTLGSK